MCDIAKIKDRLKSAILAGGVGEEAILEAELLLGVRFPPSYRTFLSQFGAALCGGFEIAGLFDVSGGDGEPPLWSSVVTYTLQKRRGSSGLFPTEYLAISDDGGDYTFYLDTSRVDVNGECPVVVLGPGADAVVIAEDFFGFVDRSFAGTILF